MSRESSPGEEVPQRARQRATLVPRDRHVHWSRALITPQVTPGTDGVARHYDDLDQYYRDIWGDHLHHGLWRSGRETAVQAIEQLVDELAAGAGITTESGLRVCDIGCGYGGTSRRLVEKYHAQVIGLTLSTAQYRYAVDETTGRDNPKYLVRDWAENGLEPNSFDAIISIECFSHVADKPEFFREIARVLRPGGRGAMAIWMAAPNASPLAVKWLLEPICREGRLPGMATSDETKAMMADAGLVVDSFEEVSRQVRQTWIICARRLIWRLLTRPHYWRALLNRNFSNRIFVVTLLRITVAYYFGAMQFGLFQFQKPATFR